jgi:hypothetical protein
VVLPLAKNTSDHIPCVVKIATVIPKAKIFRFENHWIQQPSFFDLVEKIWKIPVRAKSSAGIITAKLKNLRYELKRWGKNLSHFKDLITKCNQVIFLLDELEENRDLTRPEFNFRNIVKGHLKRLLQIQYDYWKSRCTVRWFKLGGENTNFFHSNATERYRHNKIAKISDEAGNVLFDHSDKANAFWQCYKGRMGICIPTGNPFDISEILSLVDDLSPLVEPFGEEEISNIVKYMKTDRAPGPDGFNGLFLKKCWHILKHDFLKLCADFHAGNGQL